MKKQSTDIDRPGIPCALGVEKSVLSLMMQDPVTYIGKAVEADVSMDYFYFSGHKALWNLLLTRFEKGSSTDLTSLSQALTDAGSLESLGGVAALAEIYSYDTLGAYYEHHVAILRGKYILRSIISACNASIAAAYETEDEEALLLDTVEADILAIRERTEKTSTDTLKTLLGRAIDRVEEYIKTKGALQGLSTGYGLLDARTSGLKGGDLFVIAARPSMGKTSLLLNIIEHVALDLGKPALMFSCEMPSLQLVERLLFARAGIEKKKILQGLTREDMIKFGKARSDLQKASLTLDDTAGITITELRAKARRIKREKGLSVIGIDYLQLMRSHSRQAQNSREREIAEISAGLKALAKELDVPVVVLAQLNRGPENRTGSNMGVPRMSDLRESGAIEQDADMVGLLYRLDYYADADDAKSDGKAFLELAKNRNGPTGRVPLTFIPELMRFAPRFPDPKEED